MLSAAFRPSHTSIKYFLVVAGIDWNCVVFAEGSAQVGVENVVASGIDRAAGVWTNYNINIFRVLNQWLLDVFASLTVEAEKSTQKM